MVNEQWFGDEAERALAEVCRDWCKAVRGLFLTRSWRRR